MDIRERFWSHVDKSGEHWLWTASTDKDGYPHFEAMGETRGARVAYRLQVGPIPAGYVVDHTCFIRLCVRGTDLRAITRPLNAALTRESLKAFCKRGHPRTPDNIRVEKDGRKCRPCHTMLHREPNRIRQAARRAALKEIA